MRKVELFIVLCILGPFMGLVSGTGSLYDPPSRPVMWKYGYETEKNYNYMQLNCGGEKQPEDGPKQCGVCGDYVNGSRDHELGGQYGTGLIGRYYPSGINEFQVNVELLAFEEGFFEFRLCPANNQPVTQACLDEYLLPIKQGYLTGTPFRFYPKSAGDYRLTIAVPPKITCDRCVLQWRYHTANSWGTDQTNGKEGKGYGPQEEFYNCADIRIGGEVPASVRSNPFFASPTERGQSDTNNTAKAVSMTPMKPTVVDHTGKHETGSNVPMASLIINATANSEWLAKIQGGPTAFNTETSRINVISGDIIRIPSVDMIPSLSEASGEANIQSSLNPGTPGTITSPTGIQTDTGGNAKLIIRSGASAKPETNINARGQDVAILNAGPNPDIHSNSVSDSSLSTEQHKTASLVLIQSGRTNKKFMGLQEPGQEPTAGNIGPLDLTNTFDTGVNMGEEIHAFGTSSGKTGGVHKASRGANKPTELLNGFSSATLDAHTTQFNTQSDQVATLNVGLENTVNPNGFIPSLPSVGMDSLNANSGSTIDFINTQKGGQTLSSNNIKQDQTATLILAGQNALNSNVAVIAEQSSLNPDINGNIELVNTQNAVQTLSSVNLQQDQQVSPSVGVDNTINLNLAAEPSIIDVPLTSAVSSNSQVYAEQPRDFSLNLGTHLANKKGTAQRNSNINMQQDHQVSPSEGVDNTIHSNLGMAAEIPMIDVPLIPVINSNLQTFEERPKDLSLNRGTDLAYAQDTAHTNTNINMQQDTQVSTSVGVDNTIHSNLGMSAEPPMIDVPLIPAINSNSQAFEEQPKDLSLNRGTDLAYAQGTAQTNTNINMQQDTQVSPNVGVDNTMHSNSGMSAEPPMIDVPLIPAINSNYQAIEEQPKELSLNRGTDLAYAQGTAQTNTNIDMQQDTQVLPSVGVDNTIHSNLGMFAEPPMIDVPLTPAINSNSQAFEEQSKDFSLNIGTDLTNTHGTVQTHAKNDMHQDQNTIILNSGMVAEQPTIGVANSNSNVFPEQPRDLSLNLGTNVDNTQGTLQTNANRDIQDDQLAILSNTGVNIGKQIHTFGTSGGMTGGVHMATSGTNEATVLINEISSATLDAQTTQLNTQPDQDATLNVDLENAINSNSVNIAAMPIVDSSVNLRSSSSVDLVNMPLPKTHLHIAETGSNPSTIGNQQFLEPIFPEESSSVDTVITNTNSISYPGELMTKTNLGSQGVQSFVETLSNGGGRMPLDSNLNQINPGTVQLVDPVSFATVDSLTNKQPTAGSVSATIADSQTNIRPIAVPVSDTTFTGNANIADSVPAMNIESETNIRPIDILPSSVDQYNTNAAVQGEGLISTLTASADMQPPAANNNQLVSDIGRITFDPFNTPEGTMDLGMVSSSNDQMVAVPSTSGNLMSGNSISSDLRDGTFAGSSSSSIDNTIVNIEPNIDMAPPPIIIPSVNPMLIGNGFNAVREDGVGSLGTNVNTIPTFDIPGTSIDSVAPVELNVDIAPPPIIFPSVDPVLKGNGLKAVKVDGVVTSGQKNVDTIHTESMTRAERNLDIAPPPIIFPSVDPVMNSNGNNAVTVNVVGTSGQANADIIPTVDIMTSFEPNIDIAPPPIIFPSVDPVVNGNSIYAMTVNDMGTSEQANSNVIPTVDTTGISIDSVATGERNADIAPPPIMFASEDSVLNSNVLNTVSVAKVDTSGHADTDILASFDKTGMHIDAKAPVNTNIFMAPLVENKQDSGIMFANTNKLLLPSQAIEGLATVQDARENTVLDANLLIKVPEQQPPFSLKASNVSVDPPQLGIDNVSSKFTETKLTGDGTATSLGGQQTSGILTALKTGTNTEIKSPSVDMTIKSMFPDLPVSQQPDIPNVNEFAVNKASSANAVDYTLAEDTEGTATADITTLLKDVRATKELVRNSLNSNPIIDIQGTGPTVDSPAAIKNEINSFNINEIPSESSLVSNIQIDENGVLRPRFGPRVDRTTQFRNLNRSPITDNIGSNTADFGEQTSRRATSLDVPEGLIPGGNVRIIVDPRTGSSGSGFQGSRSAVSSTGNDRRQVMNTNPRGSGSIVTSESRVSNMVNRGALNREPVVTSSRSSFTSTVPGSRTTNGRAVTLRIATDRDRRPSTVSGGDNSRTRTVISTGTGGGVRSNGMTQQQARNGNFRSRGFTTDRRRMPNQRFDPRVGLGSVGGTGFRPMVGAPTGRGVDAGLTAGGFRGGMTPFFDGGRGGFGGTMRGGFPMFESRGFPVTGFPIGGRSPILTPPAFSTGTFDPFMGGTLTPFGFRGF